METASLIWNLPAVILCVIVIALAFDLSNGIHDAANAVATVVSTGVLPMRVAIVAAAICNFGGAFYGTSVASTIGSGIISKEAVTQAVVLSALLGAITWNLLTWYFGLPSSSSHALIGGLIGSALAHNGSTAVHWDGLKNIVGALISSPLLGLVAGSLVMIATLWVTLLFRPGIVERYARRLQILSSMAMALSHGSNDAQKTMGIITMSLAAGGLLHGPAGKFTVPFWVIFACALMMGLGTSIGGKKLIKTMGAGICDLKPINGFAAETTAALTIFTFTHIGLPVSTTHVITGSIMGVGASRKLSAVRWGVTRRIAIAWILTIPMSALVGALCYYTLQPFVGS